MLLEAVRTRNEELAQTWRKSEQWATVEQLCSEWAHGTQGGLGPHRSVAGGPALVHNSCVLLEWTYLTREAASRGWEGISLRQPGPLPRYRGCAAAWPAGVRSRRELRARRLSSHVGLSALHLHEPAGHRPLRNVQSAQGLAPASLGPSYPARLPPLGTAHASAVCCSWGAAAEGWLQQQFPRSLPRGRYLFF